MERFNIMVDMRLGDSIVLASMLAHYPAVEVYIKDWSHQVDFVMRYFADQLNHVEFLTSYIDGAPEEKMQFYCIKHHIPLIQSTRKYLKGDYVTVQNMSRRAWRSDFHWDPEADFRKVKIPATPEHTLEELFGLIGGAQVHYGVDSGCAWVAASHGVPVVLNEVIQKGQHMPFLQYMFGAADVDVVAA